MAKVKKYWFEVTHYKATGELQYESYLITRSYIPDHELIDVSVQDEGDGVQSVIVYVEGFEEAFHVSIKRFEQDRKQKLINKNC